mmetsp:Transcript_114459/g.186568  ORF Transcript_114459/g.186568 Transcript_114459/m.186568 type:complete len:664 (-) Transcript_114459:190-2181(-)
MAKTKEQRAAAHQRQLERAARKRQGSKVLGSTQQHVVAPTLTVEPTAHSQILPQQQQRVVSDMDVEQACSGEMDGTHSAVAENESPKGASMPPFSAEITGRRRCSNGGHDTKFIISVTGLDGISTVERGYAEFEALLTELQPLMPELPPMPPNTLQHVCIAGRYVEMREDGLQQLLAAMLKADSTLTFSQLRKFVLADASEGEFYDPEEATEEFQNVGALESMHQEILFPSEVTGEQEKQKEQETCDAPMGEDVHTQTKKARAAMEQAAQDKLEEPKAALIEIISDSEATTDELPMSAVSSGDEDDEEISCADEQLSNLSFQESAEENEIPAELEVNNLDSHVQKVQNHDVASEKQQERDVLVDEQRVQDEEEEEASEQQEIENELEEPKAAVIDFMSQGEARTDEFQTSADSIGAANNSRIINAAEPLCTLSAELDQLIWSLSVHMNSLTESVRKEEAPTESEIVDLDSQDHVHQISMPRSSYIEKSQSLDVGSALDAYGTACDAVMSFKVGGPQPSAPAAMFHESGKVKLQARDLNAAIQSFAEAEAIHRQMGTIKTLAGAHLLLDISVAKLVSGDIDAVLEACEGICECAGLLRTTAARQFLNDVAEIPSQCGSLAGVRKILAAAFVFMEDVHKAEFDAFWTRWSQSLSTPIGVIFGDRC